MQIVTRDVYVHTIWVQEIVFDDEGTNPRPTNGIEVVLMEDRPDEASRATGNAYSIPLPMPDAEVAATAKRRRFTRK